jgi:tripartite-type tricarboxylate transporter receptor subunit TctC
MPLLRRHFTAWAGAAAFTALAPLAHAQPKTVKLLVGYAPGGAADLVARAVGEALRDSGYTVVVENKPGASGRLATDALLAAPADGATLLFAPLGNLTLYPHLFKSVKFDPLKDLAPIGVASTMGFALAVPANSPATSLQAFLKLASSNAALASFGTPGAGTAMHFLGTMLGKQAGVNLTHVPYRGGSAAVTDAVGGTLPAVITTTPNLLPMHRSGKLRILAVSDAVVPAGLTGASTFKDAGFADLTIAESFALFAKAGTAAAVVAQFNQALNTALQSPKLKSVLDKAEFSARPWSSDELARHIQAEHGVWGRVVKASGYTPED